MEKWYQALAALGGRSQFGSDDFVSHSRWASLKYSFSSDTCTMSASASAVSTQNRVSRLFSAWTWTETECSPLALPPHSTTEFHDQFCR